MKVLYNWLKEYVDFSISPAELAQKLTATGPEVVGIKTIGITKENEKNILLGKVGEVKPHPKSEKLKLCKVSAGKENIQLITNSPNIKKGDFVVVALPDTVLPNGVTVKEAEIKGEKSFGMMLAKEQLNLEEKSSDIWILGDNEKTAKRLFEVYGLEDYLYEIELTANRADCLSVIGIARETAAITEKELKINKPVIEETLDIIPDIEIIDKNLCPRYTSRIMKGIEVKPSTDEIKRKLELCGVRAINNIVDATNYVLLEFGHPTHAFELKNLAGEKIVVKTAAKGEKFTTLDSKEHQLTDEMLVICDEKRSVALAGIMGGENSEIKTDTVDVLLESAYFDPVSIRKTSQALGIKTDASYRFERTADYGITPLALDRIVELVKGSCGGSVSKMNDNYSNIFKEKIVNVKAEYISNKLGVDLSVKEIEAIVKRIGFGIAGKREDALEIKIPSFRPDVARAIDIAEEVARVYGYNKIPENRFKPPVDVETLVPKKNIRNLMREFMTSIGYTEVYNYSFINEDIVKNFLCESEHLIPLQNPLNADASIMRNYMYMGLCKAIDYNVKSTYRDEMRFYENGRTFRRIKGKIEEKTTLGIACYGKRYGYTSILEMTELVAKKASLLKFCYRKSDYGFLHPVNQAEMLYNGEVIGFLGEIHPKIIKTLDIKYPIYVAEVQTDPLNEELQKPLVVKPIGKFPPTSRDLSLIVDKAVIARDILNRIEGFHEWVKEAKFIDLFKGIQIGESKKSLTFSITFQNPERTFTDSEINELTDQLVNALKKEFKAELRG